MISPTLISSYNHVFCVCLSRNYRVPFDLTEGESELVSGFNVECCHIILISALGVIIFLGGGAL